MVRARTNAVKGLTAPEVRDQNLDALFLVWLTARATSDLLDAALAPVGLTGDEYAIYSILTAAPSITPTELARWMAAPPTTVSSYVKRFEARGHVVRVPNPGDRRSYGLRLTPTGRRVHTRAAARFAPVRARVADGLGSELEPVREALLRLRTVLDGLRQSPAGAGEGP
jgi:DNA-binding MarR family transcriptional regulator